VAGFPLPWARAAVRGAQGALAWSSIHAVGRDAVMITGADGSTNAATCWRNPMPKAAMSSVPGITYTGTDLGKVVRRDSGDRPAGLCRRYAIDPRRPWPGRKTVLIPLPDTFRCPARR